MRLDLHLHTEGSWDCLSDPEELLARAQAQGLARIAITDHNRLGVARRMADLHPDFVILGEEVRTAEGIDVIGLYLSEEIRIGTPAREVCRLVKDQGGIVYLPHPYAPGKGGDGRYAEELGPLVDVIEVFNARLHPETRNEPAEELARRLGKLRGAGSDAHTVREVGSTWIEVPQHENTPKAFLSALENVSQIRGREYFKNVI